MLSGQGLKNYAQQQISPSGKRSFVLAACAYLRPLIASSKKNESSRLEFTTFRILDTTFDMALIKNTLIEILK
jgi:hypothetical protein